MSIGLVGKKIGMTRVFNDEGASVPVTVIEVTPNRVTQLRSEDVDGYSAVQVTVGSRKENRVSAPQRGHLAKAGVEAGIGLFEFRAEVSELEGLEPGSEITVDRVEEGQLVDITGVSKGKGFAGVIKRHNFRMQDATHGNSVSHRAPGSIGQNQTPGRVFKGKKMAGHMGNVKRTTQSLAVVRVDAEQNLLLVKGAVPGAPGGTVIVNAAVKSAKKA